MGRFEGIISYFSRASRERPMSGCDEVLRAADASRRLPLRRRCESTAMQKRREKKRKKKFFFFFFPRKASHQSEEKKKKLFFFSIAKHRCFASETRDATRPRRRALASRWRCDARCFATVLCRIMQSIGELHPPVVASRCCIASRRQIRLAHRKHRMLALSRYLKTFVRCDRRASHRGCLLSRIRGSRKASHLGCIAMRENFPCLA